MLSSCRMFVYKDMTSAVTKRILDGKGGSFSIRLRKCFASLMRDGRLLARDWLKWVMQAERWSFGPSDQETVGWRGHSVL